MKTIQGCIPPVVNLLNADETIDETALANHLHHLLDAGVHGLFMLGTAGEQAALLDKERQKVIRLAVREAGKHLPVLVGVMAAGTERAVINSQEAQELGADGVVATLPYYYPTPGDAQIVDHFATIAERIHLPLILYNIPQAVKSVITLEAVKTLSKIPNIIGLKDSQEDWRRIQQLLVAFGNREDFSVLVGSEALFGAAVLLGAAGGVLGIANVVPRLCVALYETARRGEVRGAFELQKRLIDAQRIYQFGFWLSCQKAAVALLGFGEPHMTKPLPSVPPEGMDGIREVLRAHGVLNAPIE